MVKISELKNSQLMKQVAKYEKILKQLLKEKKGRLAKDPGQEDLMNAKELAAWKASQESDQFEDEYEDEYEEEEVEIEAAPAAAAPTPAPAKGAEGEDGPKVEIEDSALQLNLGDEELAEMQAESEKKEEVEEEDEEVRVTQLLKLSKEDLAELQKAKKK